jgi:hypothetical protein
MFPSAFHVWRRKPGTPRVRSTSTRFVTSSGIEMPTNDAVVTKDAGAAWRSTRRRDVRPLAVPVRT